MNESTITFPPYVKYLLAVAIAVILVWALIKIRMEFIKQKLETLKAEYELKKAVLAITLQQKERLDRKVNKMFRLSILCFALFVFVLAAVIYMVAGWSPGEWSDYLTLSTLFVSFCSIMIFSAFQKTMSFQIFSDALRRNIECSVYRKAGFDVDKIQLLQAELADNKKERKDLKAEFKKLDSCIPF